MKWLCDEYFSYAKQIFSKILMRFSGYTRLINVESTQRMFLLIIHKSQFYYHPCYRAREECNVAQREKEEAEAEQKLAEAQQHHAFFVKEQWEDR